LPALLEELPSTLVVIDGDSPFDWTTLAELRASTPEALLVLWCSHVTPEFARMACEAGVQGLLSTQLPVEEAADSLAQICRGEQTFRFEPETASRPSSGTRFTRREQQVLSLVAKGLKNREIASALRTTQGSVKVYLNRLFRKAGVRTRYELALLAGPSAELVHGTDGAPFDESWMFTGQ
jgi:DNA-binding NarL/FixJ family response regulator